MSRLSFVAGDRLQHRIDVVVAIVRETQIKPLPADQLRANSAHRAQQRREAASNEQDDGVGRTQDKASGQDTERHAGHDTNSDRIAIVLRDNRANHCAANDEKRHGGGAETEHGAPAGLAI